MVKILIPKCDFGKVTRFEVIDATGRILVRYGVAVEMHVQDEGRTLKVFLKDIKTEDDTNN